MTCFMWLQCTGQISLPSIQSIPVNGVATLTLSVEVREDTGNVSSMIDELEVLDGIHYVKILARE